MRSSDNYRAILRATSVLGGASFVNMALGLVRAKIMALAFGAAGVGILALYQQIVAVVAAAAGMGIGNVGVRYVAQALSERDERRLVLTHRALLFGSIALAAVGALAIWIVRENVALLVFYDQRQATAVGVLGIAAGFTVVAAAQVAWLNGHRRVSDIARITIVSSALGTVAFCLALAAFGRQAIVAGVFLMALTSMAVGRYYTARAAAPKATAYVSLRDVLVWSVALSREGVPIMIAALLSGLAHLTLRMVVSRQLGLEAVGEFQAAWTVSVVYIGLFLSTMGQDYFPRLSAAMKNNPAASQVVNTQTEAVFLMAGPAMVVVTAFSSWLIPLLYSDQFSGSASTLRWLVLGDVLKIASWPLGFVLLARGLNWLFLAVEMATLCLLVSLAFYLIPHFGINGVGIAFLLAYVFYLPVVFFIARRHIDFKWSLKSISLMTATFFCCGLLMFTI